MQSGTCGLCLRQADLHQSHYLPASLYKVVRTSVEPADPAPVVINAERGVSVFMNRQEKKPLLCTVCEDRFSSHGERFVADQCYRGENKFKLRDAMQSVQPSNSSSNRNVYHGNSLQPTIEPKSYMYFALSVLWRGSATSWTSENNGFEGALGKHYQEEFRKYLLDPIAPPENVAVSVYVDFDSDVNTFLHFPMPMGRQKIAHVTSKAHWFLIPGMRFIVLVGGQSSVVAKHVSDESKVSFYQWSLSKSAFYGGMASAKRSTVPTGKLAQI